MQIPQSRWLSPTPRERDFVCLESIGTSTVVPHSRRFRRDQGWRHWQFMFTVEGRAMGDIAGSQMQAEPGTIWIMPKDRSHGYECDPHVPLWTYRWIEFDGDAVADLMAMIGLDQKPWFHGCGELREQVERIQGQVIAEGDPGQHEATGRFIRLLAGAERLASSPGTADPPLVEAIRRWLERHLGDPVRLEDLARAMRLSSFHLAHRFRSATGLPPMAYLRRLRVARAKALLQRRDLSTAAVGRSVGYPLAPHFTRMFRAETGLSPKQFLASIAGSRGD